MLIILGFNLELKIQGLIKQLILQADFLYPLLPCNQSTNTFELNKKSKYVIKKVNILGQDSKSSLNYPMFYIYNDGSVEKKVMLQINN